MDAQSTKAHAVTGAYGFTGKYLARRLLDAGHRVVTLTNSPGRANPFNGAVEARPFNFHNPDELAKSLQDVEVLYNTYWVRFNQEGSTHSEAARNSLILFEAAKKAGVERIVHVSITNAEPASPIEYFSAKGHLERALGDFGLNHAIVRPAVLFGDEGILINNLAWALRRFPVFGMFGDGNYRLCPIYVDDLAAILQEQGASRKHTVINALGPEDFVYKDLIAMLAETLGLHRRIIALPPKIAYRATWLLGKLVGDVFATWDEVQSLMSNALHVPSAPPTGMTSLREWVWQHKDTLGRIYKSEVDRRKFLDKAY